MINEGYILLWSLGYLCILFLIASWGDSLKEQVIRRYKPIIIGLGVTIYCSAWSFYGITAQAVNNGWYFPPTFLGAIVLFFFFTPFLKKLVAESKRTNITSIADYLAVSYGRSRALAVLVTLVSVALLIPYIALQIKAISQNYTLLATADLQFDQVSSRIAHIDTALVIALALGFFSIVFGTRYQDSREQHSGLMIAIAFEALVKLAAFIFLAVFVSTIMFDGVEEIFLRVAQSDVLALEIQARKNDNNGYLTAVVLGLVAVMCLPRQFHVLVVESEDSEGLDTVRWFFPTYLIIFGLCTLPIGYAGLLIFDDLGITSDQYVQGLPIVAGRTGLALFTYIGGLSAGSSMVILACVAMSTMACNELVMPYLLRSRWIDLRKKEGVRTIIRNVRRGIIVILILLSYGYYHLLSNHTNLGAIGLLSFALVAQFAPSLFFSLTLNANRRASLSTAAIAGLCAGFVVWCYTLLLPEMVDAGFVHSSVLIHGPFDVSWLRPTALMGIESLGRLTNGVVWSLGANFLCFVLCSKGPSKLFSDTRLTESRVVTLSELRILLTRFLGADQTELALKAYPKLTAAQGYANSEDISVVENILSGVVGSVSARHVIENSFTGEQESEALLDKTTQIFQFGRELLQESIDNISQGISVVDSQLNLVAWNRSYLEFFEYPVGMVHVGRSVADLIRYNASKNGLQGKALGQYVNKRLKLMSAGSPSVHTYVHYTGRVLEVQGAAMAEGGFVSTYTDITNYQETVSALEETRATLESRVKERTEELQVANRQLKDANHKKTHFLAAAGHDLIQPLNAAKLFATALTHKSNDPETTQLISNLDHSLHSADAIISELLAIAKLDSGEMRVNAKTFCIGELLLSLRKDFSIIAQKKELELRCCYSSLAVTSDENLLKRILQNLLSNAIRYTPKGKILVGCRRTKTHIYIEVWDQGKGIPDVEKEDIFKEFHRLDKNMQDGGLGLGLATVQRLCQLLEIKIKVESCEGEGSVFRLIMPRGEKRYISGFDDGEEQAPRESVLAGMKMLCIDNESTILDGMKAVLETWGCVFHGITEWTDDLPWEPDALLVDYHLNDGVTGIDVAEQFKEKFGGDKPIVVISADQNNDVRAQAKSKAYFFLRKPLKAAALWSVLARINAMKSLEGTVVGKK